MNLNPTPRKTPVLFVLLVICVPPCVNAQFKTLFDFTRPVDLQHPIYTQFISDGTWLYGTARDGGTNNAGGIFRIKQDGTDFMKLKDFNGSPDGAYPDGSLTLSGDTLFGMTSQGGVNNLGCIFKINKDGTGYRKLTDFGSDTTKGAFPLGSLTISGNVLYGMTSDGGSHGSGCIFKINTDGTGYLILKDFNGSPDGANPMGSLTLSDKLLYGMTIRGGENDRGVIFSMHTDGGGFITLHNFSDNIGDGKNPYGSLTLSNNVLYGMTYSGGANNSGCVFKININGTRYSNLLDFNGTNGTQPTGSLIISGNTLYGMTNSGGAGDFGTIFKIDTTGAGYTKISTLSHQSFPTGSPYLLGNVLFGMTNNGGSEQVKAGSIFKVNVDGSAFTTLLDFGFAPNGIRPVGLTVAGNIGYGITSGGGMHNAGCIYKINTDGTGYTKLYDFSGSPDGTTPRSPLVLSDTVLYGTTYEGGTNNLGTVFKININGTGYTTLYSFNHNNGFYPLGTLVLSDNVLYGIMLWSSNAGSNAIFKINTDGTGYTKLFDLDNIVFNNTNPNIGLKISGGILYGTTLFGGNKESGNIFKINTDGTGYTNLHDFDRDADNAVNPVGTPVIIGNVLYGIASESILNQAATSAIYKISTDGNGFAVIKQFSNSEGIAPRSLIGAGDTLYGITKVNGANGAGTIFKIKTTDNIFTKVWDFSRGYPTNSDYSALTYNSGVLYGAVWDDFLIKGALFSFGTTHPNKINPVITWNNPQDITYGTLLGPTQLNATANVAGTFVYTPAAGTQLGIGNNQSLKVDFTPTDTGSYNMISKTVSINVSQTTGFGNINDDIKIYPNPCWDYITIEAAKSYESVSILDLSGKLVIRITTNGRLKNTIPAESLEAGVYLIVLKDSDNKTLVVKQIDKITSNHPWNAL